MTRLVSWVGIIILLAGCVDQAQVQAVARAREEIQSLDQLGRDIEESKRAVERYHRLALSCFKVGQSLRVGMRAEEVERLLPCQPVRVNTTITDRGVHEQWVFEAGYSWYLYFDNGRLVTIQL
jgi:hypothetical protein